MAKPARVANVMDYWGSKPPEPSPRLLYWQQRFALEGFTPNRRIRQMGYHEAAEFYGVYIWELINVIRKWEEAAPVRQWIGSYVEAAEPAE